MRQVLYEGYKRSQALRDLSANRLDAFLNTRASSRRDRRARACALFETALLHATLEKLAINRNKNCKLICNSLKARSDDFLAK